MMITADTNLLLRAIVRDDPRQAKIADRMLQDASMIVIPSTVFCEFMWASWRNYRRSPEESLVAIEALLNVQKVVTNHLAIEAGIAMERSGGDFADGVIAYEGRQRGGEVFVSFDKKAVARLQRQGFEAQLAK